MILVDIRLLFVRFLKSYVPKFSISIDPYVKALPWVDPQEADSWRAGALGSTGWPRTAQWGPQLGHGIQAWVGHRMVFQGVVVGSRGGAGKVPASVDHQYGGLNKCSMFSLKAFELYLSKKREIP